MAAPIRWRHTYPETTCPNAFRLMATRETGRYRGDVCCKTCKDWLHPSGTGPEKVFTADSLTEDDRARGVTLEKMIAVAPLVLYRDQIAMFPRDAGPALASAILRGLGKHDFEFSHLRGGMPVYARTSLPATPVASTPDPQGATS